jgi:type II secretory pathway predicted ATPase ExeA
MVRVSKTIVVKDETAFLTKGVKALRYSSVEKMLRVFKNPQMGAEVSECMGRGPVYVVKHGKYTVILLPDHAHVVEAKDEAEALKVLEELSKLVGA